MEAMLATGAVEAVAIVDADPEAASAAQALAPDAHVLASLDEVLDLGVDGVVIATPSALHADQTLQALHSGAAVFCQKPLGRTEDETRAAVDLARHRDRLLGVDFSYRFTDGMRRIAEIVRGGEIGRVYAADLVFHNAYGPDKPWFRDPRLSGGGCVMDLGIHLVDLALWLLDFPAVEDVQSDLMAQGAPLADPAAQVEDYAVATLRLRGGCVVRLACSWNLPIGRDAEISAAFHGTAGGVRLGNVGGSFYDFKTARYRGTAVETLCTPPDDWGGRAAADWARRLAAGEGHDAEAERLIDVAHAIDAIYADAVSRGKRTC
ncbi:Gfo/Idh/MocA family oxidoreductase [Rhodobacteraceae bacterium MCCB 386]|nr:Gfo/Idh/MocA family oxidoreductase [Roseitranquillus sediminis]